LLQFGCEGHGRLHALFVHALLRWEEAARKRGEPPVRQPTLIDPTSPDRYASGLKDGRHSSGSGKTDTNTSAARSIRQSWS
jgi:hypothetical protein